MADHPFAYFALETARALIQPGLCRLTMFDLAQICDEALQERFETRHALSGIRESNMLGRLGSNDS